MTTKQQEWLDQQRALATKCMCGHRYDDHHYVNFKNICHVDGCRCHGFCERERSHTMRGLHDD